MVYENEDNPMKTTPKNEDDSKNEDNQNIKMTPKVKVT